MAYDIFSKYGLDKIHENVDYDWKDADSWTEVASKNVLDSDGFVTDYTWYTNGEKHIFMFGDSDVYTPDEDYADWVCETEESAKEWFDNYNGFEEDMFEEDEIDNTPTGNADFMNDGFEHVYGLTNTEEFDDE